MLAQNSWFGNLKKVHLTCVFYNRSGFQQNRKKGNYINKRKHEYIREQEGQRHEQ